MKLFRILLSSLLWAVGVYQVLVILIRHSSFGTKRSGRVTGVEPLVGSDLVGSDAEVIETFRREGPNRSAFGRVRVHGESWQAELSTSTGDVPEIGEQVRIVGRSGLVLRVAADLRHSDRIPDR